MHIFIVLIFIPDVLKPWEIVANLNEHVCTYTCMMDTSYLFSEWEREGEGEDGLTRKCTRVSYLWCIH